jgi:hypothetical protein
MQIDAPAIATRRVKAQPPLAVQERIMAAAAKAKRVRVLAAEHEAAVVGAGRAEGYSWDRLGRLLDCPGETLRRRYAEGESR